MKLDDIPLRDLVEEIRRRSSCALLAVRLDNEHAEPEMNVRIFMKASDQPDAALTLLGLASLAMQDVQEAVHEKLMGKGNAFGEGE